MKKFKFLLLFFFCSSYTIQAQTKLPLFFSDSMVLQRQMQVSIWGKDNPNVTVVVTGSWGNTNSVTTGANGKWKLQLQTPAAGGPYTVTVKGTQQIVYKGVLIGEVWLCSGQSNMEMPMKGYPTTTPPQLVDSSTYYVANSANPNIRVFKPGWNPVSRIPLEDLTGPGVWKSATPATTPDISATAYFFARRLQMELGVPVGIIVTARGGASVESWLDSTTLASVKPVILPAVLDWQTAQSTHTMMYNTFLNPYIGYGIKGVIWSQGEANRQNHHEYRELFTKLISSWRTQWNQGKFPFYFAEVAPRGGTGDVNAVSLREAQLNTMLTVDSTGMGSTMDIGNQPNDHYPKKKVIGDRLALWALIKDYGRPGIPSGPIFKSMKTTLDTIQLSFDYVGGGLTSKGNPLTDFEIAGVNNVFYPAIATFTSNNTAINVRSSSVPQPRSVRYAFKNAVIGCLYNQEGLPAPSFRTTAMLIVLPVKFGNINVKNENDTRLVTWNSLTEIDVDRYEIQHSINGVRFTGIANIKAKGSNANYLFEDNMALGSPIIYYRIKVINTDGSSEFSKIVKVIATKTNDKIKILNPSPATVRLYCSNSVTGSIVITDNLGKTMAIKKLINQIGTVEIALPKNFKGVAIVKIIISNDEKITKRIIIL